MSKVRNAKLIQYLGEAHGKERQLETALQAHIGVTDNKRYKERLRVHLKETKGHGRDVERAIKRLGGKSDVGKIATEGAETVQGVAAKGAALAQGTVHALRGVSDQERMLKNAKTEFADEAEEIAIYLAIESLANQVGDRETARMAKSIRRDEERMATFLGKLIPTLTAAVVEAEIPPAERSGNGLTRSRNGGAKTKSRSTAKKKTAPKSSGAKRTRTTSKKRTNTKNSKAGRSRAKASAAR